MPLLLCPECNQFTSAMPHAGCPNAKKIDTYAITNDCEIKPVSEETKAYKAIAIDLVQRFIAEMATANTDDAVAMFYEAHTGLDSTVVTWSAVYLDNSLRLSGIHANATTRMNAFLLLGMWLATQGASNE